ncbi:MAG: response regulator [Saprospiraceae bacterium]|nr:response regulator [Saprospiraceae bacterium]
MEKIKGKILIADDDIDQLTAIEIIVKNLGYETITAENQSECEKIIEKTRPDLAIIDLMMDNQDSGFILSYKIKQKYPDVPVIIATAVTAETGISFDLYSDESKNWIKADLIIEKGIRPDQLEREINKLLKL